MTARSAASRGPRRHEPKALRKGQERRLALLRALESLLEIRALSQISVGDVAAAAGVSATGFYFYFSSKAAAVAALLEDIYDDALEATGHWHAVEGPAQAELRGSFTALAEFALARHRVLMAMFEAIAVDVEVREQWQRRLILPLVERVAAKISSERVAGRAPEGVDARSLASMLVALNEHAVQLEVRALVHGDLLPRMHREALIEIWQRTIYGLESE